MAVSMVGTMPANQAETRIGILNRLSGRIRFRLTNAYMFVAVFQKDQEALCCLTRHRRTTRVDL